MSNRCTVRWSPGFISRSRLRFGHEVLRVLPGWPARSALPFLVRNAKFTGSGPTVFRHVGVVELRRCSSFSENVSMFIAAHHCVAVQPMPGRPGHPARRVELHLLVGLAGAEAEVVRAVRVRARVDVGVAVRLARHGGVAGQRGAVGVRRALAVAHDHAEPERRRAAGSCRCRRCRPAAAASAGPWAGSSGGDVVARAGRFE